MRKYIFSTTLVVLLLVPTLALARWDESEQWGHGGRRTFKCESENNRHAYCRTYTTGRVELRQQLSKAPCIEYDTWKATGDGSGVWVRNGCRAEFAVKEHHWGWGAAGGGDWDGAERTFTCKSSHYSYNHCSVPGGEARKVKLVRQLSDASCVKGSSWGEDRHGVWVDNGCEGEFKAKR
ncbi:MAG: DUF3011 domain-containing protein [Candidatus Binatia bacterium]